MKKLIALGLFAATLAAGPAHAGGTYKFTVTCPHQARVVIWKTGDLDPGKEALRVSTGLDFPGCSITDFNPAQDGGLPVEKRSHEGAVFDFLLSLGSVFK